MNANLPPDPSQPAPGSARRAGLVLPLFSHRTSSDFGVGEIPDLVAAAAFAQRAGFKVLGLLPTNEVLGGETSPYSASSAFALDPVYLGLDACEDFVAAGGRGALSAAQRVTLDSLAEADAVNWALVRQLKGIGLSLAFRQFWSRDWRVSNARALELQRFSAEQDAWLDDHALFVALHHRFKLPFWQWPAALRDRDPVAMEQARQAHSEAIWEVKWQQWQLDMQWRKARSEAAAVGVSLMGDLPFMVAADSSDVWARPTEFRRDRRVGTPPDAFSAEGQDWGLPAYDWDAIAKTDFAWMRLRAARAGALFDLWRIDHVIGLYRTFFREPATANSGFSPADPAEQLKLGETLLGIFSAAGEVVAEDLGLLPPFLRPSLKRLGIPGYCVLRWEKDDTGAFKPPVGFGERSVTTTGTHDIDGLADWWEALPDDERAEHCKLPGMQGFVKQTQFDTSVHAALLQLAYGAPSRLVLIPLGDALGSRERINVPGVVADSNWSFRLPAAQDLTRLTRDREITERLFDLARQSGRV